MYLKTKSTSYSMRRFSISLLLMFALSACINPPNLVTPSPTIKTPLPSVTLNGSPVTVATPSASPQPTRTLGPSATSTYLPSLMPHSWQADPVMVEIAALEPGSRSPSEYTPIWVLYGDGLLIQRECQEDVCRYLQKQLGIDEVCFLVNTIDRTGFLAADPQSLEIPSGTGKLIHLKASVYAQNEILIPDLDRWIETPNWYKAYIGCANCSVEPVIDPAFLTMYQILTQFTPDDMSGLTTDRLALWLSEPVIAGPPQAWSEDLPPLNSLAENAICPGELTQRQALIFEGKQAREIADFLSRPAGGIPLYQQGEGIWQVQARWLLPYEMPQTCQAPPGLYPPVEFPVLIWECQPGMGAIPTPTPTITATPSQTPTPIR